MHDPMRLFSVIQEDVPAANGIIHIIDQPIINMPSDKVLRDEQVGYIYSFVFFCFVI